MTKSNREKVAFWIPQQLLPTLRQRDENLSEAIRESLSRYFAMLDRARHNLRGRLTDDELTAIATISNGTIFEPHTLEGILWNLQDANEAECLFDDTRRTELVAKLDSMSLLEHAALVDAVERFWRAVGTGMSVDATKILD
jgi:hypothetical protein